LELGLKEPTLATIEKMAAALGVSLAMFLDGLTTPKTSLAVVLSDPLNRRIIPYLKHLSAEDRSEILYQAKKMAAASNVHGGHGPTVH
jgi:transcriptional regulator with XRE-family HTH domain